MVVIVLPAGVTIQAAQRVQGVKLALGEGGGEGFAVIEIWDIACLVWWRWRSLGFPLFYVIV